MPVTSKDLIGLSFQLYSSGAASEVELRAAIGRAYYAVYHEAVALADSLALPVTRRDTGEHEQLISRYAGSSSKKLKIIATRISSVKKARTAADYHNTTRVMGPAVKQHIASCTSILDELARLTPSVSSQASVTS